MTTEQIEAQRQRVLRVKHLFIERANNWAEMNGDDLLDDISIQMLIEILAKYKIERQKWDGLRSKPVFDEDF